VEGHVCWVWVVVWWHHGIMASWHLSASRGPTKMYGIGTKLSKFEGMRTERERAGSSKHAHDDILFLPSHCWLAGLLAYWPRPAQVTLTCPKLAATNRATDRTTFKVNQWDEHCSTMRGEMEEARQGGGRS
jgi:hypothetical protein